MPFFSRLWVRMKVPNLDCRTAEISEGTEAMVRNETGRGAEKEQNTMVRVFHLARDEDISGVRGVGTVAVGAVFPSGKVVLEWLGADSSFEILDGLDHVERIHGHGGKTRIVFAVMRSVSRPRVNTRRKL
jgi:hypothetical protein